MNMSQLMKYNIYENEWTVLFNWNKHYRSMYNDDHTYVTNSKNSCKDANE